MRELLVLSPLDVVLDTLVVIIVSCGWKSINGLLVLDLNFKNLTGRLSPPVIVLEEHVVQMKRVTKFGSKCVHVRWDVISL